MSSRLCLGALLLASACLSPAIVRAAEASPLPIKLPTAVAPEAAAMQERIYLAAQKQLRSLLPLVQPWSEYESLLLMTESKSGEHWIRPNTGMIYGMAILYRFGPYDESITGISREKLLREVLLPMMRYCLATHKTGDRVTSDGKAWGDAWQSAHWANMLGSAAWLIWDDLPEEMRTSVRRLVAYEADRFRDADPPHNLRKDTKAEENGWNSQILAIAPILMPDDDRREAWERAFQRWALSALLRPADETSQTLVDGKPVAEQFAGANLLDDFTLENHGFVHPDYMTTYSQTLASVLRYRLTGREPPEALFYNVSGLYENLKWFALPDGGFVYPSGQDWELFRNPGWVYPHVLMAAYMNDPDAWSLANRSLVTLEKMQARHASGQVIRDDETRFPSAKTGLLLSLGQSWLVLSTAQKIHDSPQPKVGVLRLDAGAIILHRTPQVVNCVSWGAKTMAMSVPLRLDRIISPDQRSGIGHIRLKESDVPLPIKTIDAQVKSEEDSFTAHLVVEHGEQLFRAEIQIASDAQGTFTISEKLVATADVTTQEIATGLVGILNNPHWVYETGRREFFIKGERVIVEALTGEKWQQSGASALTIDKTLQFTSDNPLSIAYHGAERIERGRATDMLFLNYHGEEKTWRKGDVVSEYSVRIRPADLKDKSN